MKALIENPKSSKKISYPDTRLVGSPMDSNTQLIATKVSSNLVKRMNLFIKHNNTTCSSLVRGAIDVFLQEQGY